MFKVILSWPIVFSFVAVAPAQEIVERYTSGARDKKGATTYQEKHEVTFKDRRVSSAKTQYLDSNGQLIGEMKSDFTKKITVPEYEYKDHRTGSSHGIKLDGEKMTLWQKTKDGKTESSDFFQANFPSDTLLVGCQGLHYYLIDNLDMIREKKSIPIAYFIPGKLDYYRFTLKLDREDEKHVYLKLTIDNLFLRLFASTLDLKYSKEDRRLIQYSGLSNITNEKDQMQDVVIDYKYD